MLDDLKWRCHICGDERPDHLIGVITHQRMMGTVPFQENVRYCVDKTSCQVAAQDASFTKKSRAAAEQREEKHENRIRGTEDGNLLDQILQPGRRVLWAIRDWFE